MKDFFDIREIGAGSYGKVKLVELHDNLYAVKQVSQDLIQRYEKVANVYFERDVLQASNSLSIPQFYFAFRVSWIEINRQYMLCLIIPKLFLSLMFYLGQDEATLCDGVRA